jgi:hypothetical protein
VKFVVCTVVSGCCHGHAPAERLGHADPRQDLAVEGHVVALRLARDVALVRRRRRVRRAGRGGQQDRPLAGLRHAVALGLEDARPRASPSPRGAGEQRPQLQHGRDLLERDPLRLQRERPAQRLDDEHRPGVFALRGVHGARVVARGELAGAAGDDVLDVAPTAALAGHRPRLARGRGDQPVDRREAHRVQRGDVGLHALVTGGARHDGRRRSCAPLTWEHGLVDLFAKLIERDDYGGDRLRRRTLRAPQPPTGDDGRRQQQYDSEGDDGVGHATDSSSSSSSSEIGPGIGSMKK